MGERLCHIAFAISWGIIGLFLLTFYFINGLFYVTTER